MITDLMRVPDEIRDCVCFVEATWAGKKSVGTAFFVGAQLGLADVLNDDKVLIYAVTAKHCIMRGGQLPDELALRVNTRNASAIRIKTDPLMWVTHASSDCAVLPLKGFDISNLSMKVYPLEKAATAEAIKDRSIGPGDDVFLTGLLVHHPGHTRIMPIVRLGTIAGMPNETVIVGTGKGDSPDVVTLLELHSIGGISGSPVFVHLPFWRDAEKGSMFVSPGVTASSGGENLLLGLMHGFYPVRKNDPEEVSGGDENLNTGIAVVVRVDRILELVNEPAQVAWREGLKGLLEKEATPEA